MAARASGEGVAASEAVGSVEAVAITGVPLTVNVGAPEALAQALTEGLPLDEKDLRGLREPRAVAVVDGDAMEAVAVPDGGGDSLAKGHGVAVMDTLAEPLWEGLGDVLGVPLRERDPAPLRVGDALAEGHRVRTAEALGQREAENVALEVPLREGEPQEEGEAVCEKLRVAVPQRLGEADTESDCDVVRERGGVAEPQRLDVPLLDAEGEPDAVRDCEGEPDAVEERDWVTLAVKLGECEAEPDAKAEPLKDTLGDTVPLVVAEGVHVPPQPMYCFSAFMQFQLMVAPVH